MTTLTTGFRRGKSRWQASELRFGPVRIPPPDISLFSTGDSSNIFGQTIDNETLPRISQKCPACGVHPQPLSLDIFTTSPSAPVAEGVTTGDAATHGPPRAARVHPRAVRLPRRDGTPRHATTRLNGCRVEGAVVCARERPGRARPKRRPTRHPVPTQPSTTPLRVVPQENAQRTTLGG
jgi:hypothetical protein